MDAREELTREIARYYGSEEDLDSEKPGDPELTRQMLEPLAAHLLAAGYRRLPPMDDALVERAADAIGDAWDCEKDDDERLRVYARAALRAALEPHTTGG